MLAIRLIICRGGVFVIEQPATSVVFRHPRFNELLKLVTETWLLDMSTYVCLNHEKLRLQKPLLFKHWIPLKVYKQSFWMQGWGGKTPKRTTLWSNSSAIRLFKTGSEHSKTSKLMKGKGLTDRYKDRSGRWRFKGNSRLKGSQSLPYFWAKLCITMIVVLVFGRPCTCKLFDMCYYTKDLSGGFWCAICKSNEIFSKREGYHENWIQHRGTPAAIHA